MTRLLGRERQVHQVGKFFLEFDKCLEFSVLELQCLETSGIALALVRSVFSLLLSERVIVGDEFSLFVLLSEGSESGRVDRLAAQQGSELSVLVALVGFVKDTQFVGDGKTSSSGALVDLRVRQRADKKVRHRWITFSP